MSVTLLSVALSAQTTQAPPSSQSKLSATEQNDWDKAVKQAAEKRASTAAQSAKNGLNWSDVQPCTGKYLTPGWTSAGSNPCDHTAQPTTPRLACHVGHNTREDVKAARRKGLAAAVTVGVLRDAVSSDSALGKKVRVHTEHAVKFSDGTPLPRGTELIGEVIDRNTPAPAHPIGGVSVRFNQARLPDGNILPVSVLVRGGSEPADFPSMRLCSSSTEYADCLNRLETAHNEDYWAHHSPHMCAGLPGAAILSNNSISATFVAPDKAVHVDQGSELTLVIMRTSLTP